jgi:hypothetical protein
MTPQQDVADVARLYTDATRELANALADRDRLVQEWKATGIRPVLAMAQAKVRVEAATEVVVTLRETLQAINGRGA